jgi:hypothetical protein
MSTKITRDEWLAELERLGIALDSVDDDGRTAEEWAERWHCAYKTAQKRLRLLHRKGCLRPGRRNAIRIDGSRTRIPVYVIVKPEKGK